MNSRSKLHHATLAKLAKELEEREALAREKGDRESQAQVDADAEDCF